MSDPTTVNRLYAAGWAAFCDGHSDDPGADPVVRELLATIPVGDQRAADLQDYWLDGYRTARDRSTS